MGQTGFLEKAVEDLLVVGWKVERDRIRLGFDGGQIVGEGFEHLLVGGAAVGGLEEGSEDAFAEVETEREPFVRGGFIVGQVAVGVALGVVVFFLPFPVKGFRRNISRIGHELRAGFFNVLLGAREHAVNEFLASERMCAFFGFHLNFDV